MRAGGWALGGIVLLFALVGIEGFVSRQPSWLWQAKASSEACSVYRSFYRTFPANQARFLRSGTVPWKGWRIYEGDSPPDLADPSSAPTHFMSEDPAPGSGQERREFRVDTSACFRAVASKRSLFIRGCFESDGKAAFFDGPWHWFFLRERLLHGRDASLLEVSPVAFSPDGTHALLHAEYICYGLCGAGIFFLFEKRDNVWRLAGTLTLWMS